MRKEVEAALRGLSPQELQEARRLVDGLLAGMGGALHSAPPGVDERRRFPRFAVSLQATFQRDAAGPGGASAEPALHQALVRDISRGGVGFLTSERVKAGEILTFYLPGESGVRKLLVEVVRAQARGEQFECGGQFVGPDRAVAARRTRMEEAEMPEVLVVGEPGDGRDALVNLVMRQGYAVEMANSASEALVKLSTQRHRIVLAAGSLLLAEAGRLLERLHALKGDVRIVAVAPAPMLEGADGQTLRTCHDYICEPNRASEVQVVLARTCLRLAAAPAAPASV